MKKRIGVHPQRCIKPNFVLVGCFDGKSDNEDKKVKFGRSDFVGDSSSPKQLWKANQVWVYLIVSCKWVMVEIVSASLSPSEAWNLLFRRYWASGLRKGRTVDACFYTLKVELGGNPSKFLLWVDRMTKELQRVD